MLRTLFVTVVEVVVPVPVELREPETRWAARRINDHSQQSLKCRSKLVAYEYFVQQNEVYYSTARISNTQHCHEFVMSSQGNMGERRALATPVLVGSIILLLQLQLIVINRTL